VGGRSALSNGALLLEKGEKKTKRSPGLLAREDASIEKKSNID
jgi:hypothetical protein